MSGSSNNNGRAFEYITLIALKEEISKFRKVGIKTDNSYNATKKAWHKIDENVQLNLKNAAEAAIESIFDLEPLILEDDDDTLELLIQPDGKGEEGDVRDIILVRRNIQWEIGLSLKHNHRAVKHSRIGKDLDFGDVWFGVPCSEQYWEDTGSVFNYLEHEKNRKTMWRNIPDKKDKVYIPLLNAFKNELLRSYNSNPKIAKRLFEYLIGKHDFYKVISNDDEKITEIETYNSTGTLNKASRESQPKKLINELDLPTQIIDISFKPKSKTTIIISMDKGWKFNFRIHSAETYVIPSLKFDITAEEKPRTVDSIICEWNSI